MVYNDAACLPIYIWFWQSLWCHDEGIEDLGTADKEDFEMCGEKEQYQGLTIM